MLNYRRTLTVCIAAVLTVTGAAAVHAWENLNRTTYVTVNRPFALPGVALPAGTYVFELAAPDSSVDLVRVMSRDRTQVYLTVFTNRISRPAGQQSNRTLSFGEFKVGMTPPVTAWYPVGSPTGHQFIYAKNSRQLTDR